MLNISLARKNQDVEGYAVNKATGGLENGNANFVDSVRLDTDLDADNAIGDSNDDGNNDDGNIDNTGMGSYNIEEAQAAGGYEGAIPGTAGDAADGAKREVFRAGGTIDVFPRSKGLSNGKKVLLTILCTLIPGFGQLAGIITSIVFINDQDNDKRSFGIALLVASLIFFVISCFVLFIVFLVLISRNS